MNIPTGFFSSKIRLNVISINFNFLFLSFVAQSVVNYMLLTIVYTPGWLLLTHNKSTIINCFKNNWWKYFLIAFADVEANYFMIKAYSLTILTTIQVIDAFILPITLLLSFIFLKLSYRFNNIAGVVACLIGCGLIILADSFVKNENGFNPFFGRLNSFSHLIHNMHATFNVSIEF